jgi:hypothetical protein
MKRFLLPFLIALLIGIIVVTYSSSDKREVILPPAAVLVSENEELNVYTAVIDQMYPETQDKSVIVAESSNDCPPNEKEPGWEERMLNEMPEVSVETFGDYLINNKVCYSFSTHSALKGKYTVLSDREIMEVVRNDTAGWREFYANHPNSFGFITFSRIGFNPQINQAFVYTGSYSGVNRGYGTHILLLKNEGHWIIKQKYRAWSS